LDNLARRTVYVRKAGPLSWNNQVIVPFSKVNRRSKAQRKYHSVLHNLKSIFSRGGMYFLEVFCEDGGVMTKRLGRKKIEVRYENSPDPFVAADMREYVKAHFVPGMRTCQIISIPRVAVAMAVDSLVRADPNILHVAQRAALAKIVRANSFGNISTEDVDTEETDASIAKRLREWLQSFLSEEPASAAATESQLSGCISSIVARLKFCICSILSLLKEEALRDMLQVLTDSLDIKWGEMSPVIHTLPLIDDDLRKHVLVGENFNAKFVEPLVGGAFYVGYIDRGKVCPRTSFDRIAPDKKLYCWRWVEQKDLHVAEIRSFILTFFLTRIEYYVAAILAVKYHDNHDVWEYNSKLWAQELYRSFKSFDQERVQACCKRMFRIYLATAKQEDMVVTMPDRKAARAAIPASLASLSLSKKKGFIRHAVSAESLLQQMCAMGCTYFLMACDDEGLLLSRTVSPGYNITAQLSLFVKQRHPISVPPMLHISERALKNACNSIAVNFQSEGELRKFMAKEALRHPDHAAQRHLFAPAEAAHVLTAPQQALTGKELMPKFVNTLAQALEVGAEGESEIYTYWFLHFLTLWKDEVRKILKAFTHHELRYFRDGAEFKTQTDGRGFKCRRDKTRAPPDWMKPHICRPKELEAAKRVPHFCIKKRGDWSMVDSICESNLALSAYCWTWCREEDTKERELRSILFIACCKFCGPHSIARLLFSSGNHLRPNFPALGTADWNKHYREKYFRTTPARNVLAGIVCARDKVIDCRKKLKEKLNTLGLSTAGSAAILEQRIRKHYAKLRQYSCKVPSSQDAEAAQEGSEKEPGKRDGGGREGIVLPCSEAPLTAHVSVDVQSVEGPEVPVNVPAVAAGTHGGVSRGITVRPLEPLKRPHERPKSVNRCNNRLAPDEIQRQVQSMMKRQKTQSGARRNPGTSSEYDEASKNSSPGAHAVAFRNGAGATPFPLRDERRATTNGDESANRGRIEGVGRDGDRCNEGWNEGQEVEEQEGEGVAAEAPRRSARIASMNKGSD
jgi:hypothetical protein